MNRRLPATRGRRSPHLARRPLVLVLVLALALALTTAAGASAATGARSPAISAAAVRAAGYLTRAQNPDGGLGAAPGDRSSPLFSGWAALGLASEGIDIASLRRGPADPTLLQYVERGARTAGSGALERTILALRAGGVSVTDLDGRNLAGELARRFSRRGAVSGLVNLTAFGLLSLCAAGEASTRTVEDRAAGWLAREANRNGGYGFAGRGSQSDADDTGAVLEALHCAPRPAAAGVARARRRALAYLRRDEDRDGGFPSAPGAGSNAQSTAWAVQGLIAAGVDPSRVSRDGHTPLRYLAGLVSRSGRVAYARGLSVTPVWVTGEALLALTGTPLPITAPRQTG